MRDRRQHHRELQGSTQAVLQDLAEGTYNGQVAPKDLPVDVWARRDDQDVREMIVLAYWPMLARVVGRVRQSLPDHAHVEEEDLRAYGMIGFYKALDRFDPDLGFQFDKFASNFVRGACLDELRSLDWASRSLRKRQKELDAATALLADRLHRVPEDPELAEELLWTVNDVQTTRRQVDTVWPRSLDEIRKEADEKDLYAIVANAQGAPEQNAIGVLDSHENDRSSILVETMASHIAKMNPQKQAVVVLCYYLNMPQSQVADALGIPTSRVGQLHQQVMEEIHLRLEELLA